MIAGLRAARLARAQAARGETAPVTHAAFEMLEVNAMSTRLEIAPDYREALFAAGFSEFEAFLGAPAGPPASKHEHRETVPITINIGGRDRRFFLKRVFKVPPKHAFWPVFRGEKNESQPAREWRICHQLAEAGIPVMKPVAYGERRRFGMPREAFLLVEAVPFEFTLEDWLIPGFEEPPRAAQVQYRRLFDELGHLAGRLYRAGFDWPDNFAKHIYAAPTSGPRTRWEFCLIDVERMMHIPRASAAVAGREACERPPDLNLSVKRLIQSLYPAPLSRHDYWRFWSGVLRGAGFHKKRGRGFRHTQALSRHLMYCDGWIAPPRLPDDYRHPRATELEHLDEMTVDAEMLPRLRAAGLGGLDSMFRYEGGEALRKRGLASHRDRLRISVPNNNGGVDTLYLKRYWRPPLGEQLRRIRECGRKRSSAGREFHFIKRLASLGIPTMRRIAYGQRMGSLFEEKSFCLTAAVPGESLEKVAARAMADASTTPSWRDRREIIEQLARITRRMHMNGLFHRDLYLSHVFLSRNRDGGVVLFVIDLARMIERARQAGRRWMIKDLAALAYSAPSRSVTRADRLRFLYHYDPFPLAIPRGKRRGMVRRFVREIEARTRRMDRHDAKRAGRAKPEGQT